MDYIIAGILLMTFGLIIEFILRKMKSNNKKVLLISISLMILFLLWAELAVGIFGLSSTGN